MKTRQQNSTANPITILMIDSTDHIAGKTGLTLTVTVSKNGGAFGAASGAITEIANGWYSFAGNATDRNTLGDFVVHATATGADPYDEKYAIVPWNPFDANLSLTNLDAAISTRSTYAGGAVASVTAAVTVGTNNDKTGYSLTQAFPANFSAMAIASGTGQVGLDFSSIKQATTPTTLTDITIPNVTNVLTDVGITQAGADHVWTSTSRSLTDSVTVTQSFPSNFSSLSISGTGQVGLDFTNIKQATGATTLNNITIPTVTNVTNDVGITQAGANKAWATTTRVLTAGTNIALAKGTGVTGFNDIAAADVWAAGTRTLTAFSFSVTASNMISDYQQRSVAVTLPSPAPTGYGATATVDTAALAGAILANPSNKLVTNSSGAVLLPNPPQSGYGGSGGSSDTFIDPGVTPEDLWDIH